MCVARARILQKIPGKNKLEARQKAGDIILLSARFLGLFSFETSICSHLSAILINLLFIPYLPSRERGLRTFPLSIYGARLAFHPCVHAYIYIYICIYTSICNGYRFWPNAQALRAYARLFMRFYKYLRNTCFREPTHGDLLVRWYKRLFVYIPHFCKKKKKCLRLCLNYMDYR
ncbi:hypothetical protein POVWA2_052660 [Plasmodium ovale wallikeri]|uniref:Uncharacterized protein n=1 Tax=Plasmodium ovale wallikeri TaxID=864142 RepID=A0A1A8ZSF1_PLAOA|nr:hypothetical protein POVWA1_053390 [Plasmodium ovale wallikeri]SBT46791.1 hypothetical protein POVWA2_052660 [Plasmodium ovale wallikeri]